MCVNRDAIHSRANIHKWSFRRYLYMSGNTLGRSWIDIHRYQCNCKRNKSGKKLFLLTRMKASTYLIPFSCKTKPILQAHAARFSESWMHSCSHLLCEPHSCWMGQSTSSAPVGQSAYPSQMCFWLMQMRWLETFAFGGHANCPISQSGVQSISSSPRLQSAMPSHTHDFRMHRLSWHVNSSEVQVLVSAPDVVQPFSSSPESQSCSKSQRQRAEMQVPKFLLIYVFSASFEEKETYHHCIGIHWKYN